METSVNIDRGFVFTCVAISLHQLSYWILNTWVFAQFASEFTAGPVALVTTSAACCLAILALLWFSRTVLRPAAVLLCSLFPLACATLVLYGGMQEHNYLLTVLGCALYGTADFWTFALPALALSGRREGEVVACVFVAILIRSIVQFFSAALPIGNAIALGFIFLASAGAVLLSYRRAFGQLPPRTSYHFTSVNAEKPSAFFSAIHPALLAFLVSGIAFGFGAAARNGGGAPRENLLAVVPLAAAVLGVVLMRRDRKVDTLYLISALLILGGFAFFFPSSLASSTGIVANLSDIFFAAGYDLFVLTAFVFIAAIGSKNPLDSLRAGLTYYCLVDIGTAIGASLRHSLFSLLQEGPDDSLAFLVVSAIILLFASYIVVVAKRSDLSRSILRLPGLSPAMARDASLDIERRCQLCAEKHSLTPREQEILEYLALGYTAIGIKDKLTISQNTAKSHIKNIYRKMGVHSQQQLIDAVFD